MGTRNLTVVTVDGTRKVAQYCQWDGYPSGVGKDIAKFLSDIGEGNMLKEFKSKVRGLRWPALKKSKRRGRLAGLMVLDLSAWKLPTGPRSPTLSFIGTPGLPYWDSSGMAR